MPSEQILLTGAAGRIGSFLRTRLAASERRLRLLDITPIEDVGTNEEALVASITDKPALVSACAGVDTIIHLAAISTESTWDQITEVNINGTQNVFDAARKAGVKRVIFASSNHAVGFHPIAEPAIPDYVFPQPDTFYGVSKVAGEAIGSLYHSRYGIEVVCIRILSCYEQPINVRMLATWLSPNDAGRIFNAALECASPGFKVVWGVSNNTRARFSLDEAKSLGYESLDNAEKFAAEVLAESRGPRPDAPEALWIGGPFCGPDFDAA